MFFLKQVSNDAIYIDKSVNVVVEETALYFESALRNEYVTMGSPLNSLVISANVVSVSKSVLGQRIHFTDYVAKDFESPEGTVSQISSTVSVFDCTSDEFKYQRIEDLTIFGPLGKAESAHVMSKKHCRENKRYHPYDRNKSNRLALSRDLHGFYDQLCCNVPLFNIKVNIISEQMVIDDRYEVICYRVEYFLY